MKNIVVKKIPLLPNLTAYIIGIWFESYFNIRIIYLAITLICIFLFYFLFSLTSPLFKLRYKYFITSSLLVMISLLGSLRIYMIDVKNDKHFAANYSSAQSYLVRINEPLQRKPKSYKTTASLEKIFANGNWHKATGNLFIYFRVNNFKSNISIGSQIIFNRKPQLIKNAGNPGEFDYATYCHRKGIYFQEFLSDKEYVSLPQNNTSFFEVLLNNTREKIIQTIDENIAGKEEQAVAKALLIGYRNDLDKDVLQAFANAGVIHIIAISGMHLILIGGIFLWIFSPLKRWKNGKLIQVLLVLSIVWFFTFIAGGVPSITRAAIMFSVFICAVLFGRQYAIYNSLAFSALLLLLINPYNLWDAGFVLSYAAVLSIVLFYKYIHSAKSFDNKVLKTLWELITMSIAAQILTLPFVLYYFHRFPVLFLFANIVAVPLSTIILYMEIILLAVSFVHPAALFAGKIVASLISFFDIMMQYFGNLKFAVIDFADINIVQMLLLICCVFGLYFFIAFKTKNGITVFVCCLLSCIIIGSAQFIRQSHQHKLIVYNIPKHAVTDIFNGHSYASYSDTLLDKKSDEYAYTLKLTREKFHVYSKNASKEIYADFPEIIYRKKHLYVLNENSIDILNTSSNPDIIIVEAIKYLNIQEVHNRFPKAFFVFTNANSLWKIEQWKKSCIGLHLHFHSIPDKGAFVMNM
ncbi:MAG: ComEC/Rec2 family competence protein [Arachidicoccus sp.]|nr:ComEC/Rec2 family competence protein [Arachidicoccus sp.]